MLKKVSHKIYRSDLLGKKWIGWKFIVVFTLSQIRLYTHIILARLPIKLTGLEFGKYMEARSGRDTFFIKKRASRMRTVLHYGD